MPKEKKILRRSWIRVKKNHRANRGKGVYGYMGWAALKIILIYVIIFVPLLLIVKKYVDFNAIFTFVTHSFSDPLVLITFFLSESFLGMIPPDIFVIWTIKFHSPFIILLLLGLLSYAGGIISYFIGSWLSNRKRIKEYSERALDKYIQMVRKWGGAFIIIAALFPFSPFSMVVIALSLLKYPFRYYLFFGLSRILRFIIQGIFFLKIMNLDSFFS